MKKASEYEKLLIRKIRDGDSEAWAELIRRFEGRLLSFIRSRVKRRALAEDLVQETFVGFLLSLPNFDAEQSLESYLFAIAAHKLTDHLRRSGRRPKLVGTSSTASRLRNQPADQPGASTQVHSYEQQRKEEAALAHALQTVIDYWRNRGDWPKIKCAELLFVRGWPNKKVAQVLGLSEQVVANYKFEFINKLRKEIAQLQTVSYHLPEV